MSRRNPWSGLAPAVDAHIAYWARANRAGPMIDTIAQGTYPRDKDGDAERYIKRALEDQHIYRWVVFGASYGIPDANGVPMVVVSRREDAFGDGESGIHISTQEGATLATMKGVEAKVMVTEEAAELIEDDDATVANRELDPNARPLFEGSTIMGREQFRAEGAAVLQGLNLASRERIMLGQATSHYVSAEVCEEISNAAVLAANEPLRETDVFCPAGFAVFEEPIQIPDVAPEDGSEVDDLWIHIRAIGWHVTPGIANMATGKVGKGVSIFLYTTREDYESGYYQCLLDTGREVPYTPEQVSDGFIPVEVLPWTFDVPWDARATVGYIPGTVPNAIAYERRWFFAFMRLMWQRIIVHQRPPMQRQVRRRLERMAERKPLLDYTVLRLRRVVDPSAEPKITGTGRKLDHRVLARGYWMNAYLHNGPARLPDGTMDPNTHRLVWIEPAWRGPLDGPVGAMEHATVVVR